MFSSRILMLCMMGLGLAAVVCSSLAALDVGDVVVVKASVPLKRSGKVVGQAKEGETLTVKAVRGVWIDVGQGISGWLREDQVIAGEEAIAFFDERIAKNPRDAQLLLARGQLEFQWDDIEAAQEDFRQALSIDEKLSPAHYFLGKIAQNEQDYGRALQYYNDAIKYADKPELPLRARAKILWSTQKQAQAVADWERLVSLDVATADEYNSLAWRYATSTNAAERNGDKAVIYARKACDLTGYNNWAYLDTLAAAFAETNDFSNAQTWQKQALENCGDPSMKPQLRARLKQYELSKPYRE